ncbi:MAG: alpha/beta hydrolase fold domain-containing protein [Sphingomonas sp.]|nr:alpha/beta hydrolase fold domain-containing protein [Sphingomonas sp.]
MRWAKRVTIGFGVVLALIVLTGIALAIWKPWVFPIQMADPGPSGRRLAIHGQPANYFPAAGTGQHAAILLLGGSEGGLGTSAATMARALQAHGYAVLQLSYFRAPGQPKALARIPIEGFDAGLAWLARQPDVDSRRLAIMGGSKGAEAALLVASRHPELKAVVAGMPSSVVWPGFSWEMERVEGSSWTIGGRDVPALPFGQGSFSEGIGSIYVNGLKRLPAHAEAAIPIERSPAPVLLICGETDTLWPSCLMARQLVKRDVRVTILAYKDAGHAVFGVPVAESDPSPPPLSSLGGSVVGNNAARRDSWPKVLAFLDQALRAGT